MLKAGLTGGIACGKSRAARRMAARGLHVLDLDGVAHELMTPGGAAYEDVVRAFGEGVLSVDGAIDRRALAARVFGDREALARLNAIVHPRVREEEARRAAALAGSGEVLVTDAAILVESGLHLRFDRLVVVDCRPEQQVERLQARDGMAAEAARARLAAQMPAEDKRRFAHFVIDGSLAFAETNRMADAVADALRELASRPPQRVAVPPARALAALARGPRRGPRGLTPDVVLAEIAAAGGIEMETLARRLDPPSVGPWYRAASAAPDGPGPEALAVPVALWSLARRGLDPEYTAAAAASVARLTHREPSAVADACLASLAIAHVAAGGTIAAPTSRWADWSRLAERWGGGAPSGGVDRAAARAAEAAESGPADLDGSLAGAFAGMATGASPAPPPPERVRALEVVSAAAG